MRYMGDVTEDAERQAYSLAIQTTGGAKAYAEDMGHAKWTGALVGGVAGVVLGMWLAKKKKR